MIRPTTADYTPSHEDGEPEIVYRVEGVVHPIIAAVTSGPPDRWAPPEGGEVEDLVVYWPGGKVRVPPALWAEHGLDADQMEERLREVAFSEVRE